MSPRESVKSTTSSPTRGTETAIDKLLFVASIDVRWRDLDAFNHVNNSNFLTYLEEARLQWLAHERDWFGEACMPVLAASELQYRRPIPWPASLHVELRCIRLGNSSITIAVKAVRLAGIDDTVRDGDRTVAQPNAAQLDMQ
jgi:acyl-CoA thioester hydrolase